ncbi:glycosyltransferase [Bifidobacterium adolescentis]|uniref:glycosyltransferase n=1 Tax=Bifidobacterium adolescentis TaxID=1680 RepID=UPI0011061707|nr:glycosyltransferase [Bifidobacterium adolescentis]MDB0644999.1 glycosyltransferase [Bifidobacterium adolescentis]MDB1402792.1 glycosyltransferase [Bifidobacterium adolescentis]MDB1406276.1 glycosyltransferase [Bifidobacterium adolescentis]MDB1408071.1 glycosyltransferase [Bifidobacterium adolescentis]MDB1411444.1 glycosyltransferase [Bifidobacterium adolescentis]
MRHFFQVDEKDAAQIENLSKRMQRLVYGAVDYNSLIQPGRTLTYKLYMGEKWQYPRLTDTSTLSGNITEQMGLVPFMVFKATSVSRNQTDFSPHYFAGDDQILDHNVRHILLTPDDATDRDVELNHPVNSKAVKLYNTLESSMPTAFDVFRDAKRTMREHVGKKSIPMTMARNADNVNKAGKVQHPWVEVTPGRAPKGSPRAVVVAMHWFQAGGAERWALETVKLVRDAGFIPIVITDRDGHQPWIADPAFDDAILLPMTMPVQERPGDSPVLRALFEQFDIAGILIHHCQWMYDNAWWVKTHFPQTRIVDSLHIVEYYFHGGFPKESVAHDEWIDLHHVISPQLEHWLINDHQIAPEKVVDAPLVGLTADAKTPSFKERDKTKPFTVAYIGRMVRQKRPEAFILAAKAVNAAYPGKVRFIMQGNGDMDAFSDMMIKRYGLEKVIERRALDAPVAQTYRDADALLISSINEGITLTSIEAISAGVPVLSANVGSQETLIPPKGLCRRMTSNFVHDAKSALSHILNNEEDRRKLWESELARLQKFSELESAEAYFKKMLKEWHD